MFPLAEAVGLVAFGGTCLALGYALGCREDELPPEPAVTGRAHAPEGTATRKVTSFGEVGRCNCSACDWCVDPYDQFCRRCGVRFTGTEYERAKR